MWFCAILWGIWQRGGFLFCVYKLEVYLRRLDAGKTRPPMEGLLGGPGSLEALGLSSRPPAFSATRRRTEGGVVRAGGKEDFWGQVRGKVVFVRLETVGQKNRLCP